MNLRLPCYARLEQLANGLRLEAGDQSLSDEECLMRLLDELEARREGDRLAAIGDAETRGNEVVSAPANHGCEASRHIPAGIRRRAMIRARYACEVDGCRNRFGLEVHHKVRFCDGGSHPLENVMVVCSRCHMKMHREQQSGELPPLRPLEQARGPGLPQGKASVAEESLSP